MLRRLVSNVTLNRFRAAMVAVEKQKVLHILRVFFVALVIQHAKRLRHIVFCDVANSAVFLHIISRMTKLSRKAVEHKTSVLVFSTSFV